MIQTPDRLEFVELEDMDAPSWESFYTGLLLGIGTVAAVIGAT